MKSSRTLTKTQRKYYNKLLALIGEDNLKERDVFELENCAMCLQLIEEAEKGIKENGTIQTYKNGTRQISPEFTQWQNAVKMFEQYVKQLGLSPKARADLGLEGAKEEKSKDPLAGLRAITKKGKVKNG